MLESQKLIPAFVKAAVIIVVLAELANLKGLNHESFSSYYVQNNRILIVPLEFEW